MNRESIFEYVKKKYGTLPEFLWIRYPNCAVLRHKENRKWYAVIMDVPKNKLGYADTKVVDILDVKVDPVMIGSLLKVGGIIPAYHMNKAHWISIVLDDFQDDEMLFSLLDMSAQLTLKTHK